jgi:hypothetical protein
MTDLNTLIPANSPLYILEGTSNNDLGQIVGIGMTTNGDQHAFLATPVGDGGESATIAEARDTVQRPAITPSANLHRMLKRRGRRFGSQ